MAIFVNALIGGGCAFVLVFITVYVCAYFSPIWTLVISALPFSLIFILAVMHRSQIDTGRLNGTLFAYFISTVVLCIVVGTWTFLSFNAKSIGGENTRLWLSLAVCTSVWVLLCGELFLAYYYIPMFRSLIDSGTTKVN